MKSTIILLLIGPLFTVALASAIYFINKMIETRTTRYFVTYIGEAESGVVACGMVTHDITGRITAETFTQSARLIESTAGLRSNKVCVMGYTEVAK